MIRDWFMFGSLSRWLPYRAVAAAWATCLIRPNGKT
jgi:hypothetical protein